MDENSCCVVWQLQCCFNTWAQCWLVINFAPKAIIDSYFTGRYPLPLGRGFWSGGPLRLSGWPFCCLKIAIVYSCPIMDCRAHKGWVRENLSTVVANLTSCALSSSGEYAQASRQWIPYSLQKAIIIAPSFPRSVVNYNSVQHWNWQTVLCSRQRSIRAFVFQWWPNGKNTQKGIV